MVKRDSASFILLMKLEAPPGFEPGVEVLQMAAADQFGDRYVVEFELEGPQGKAIVRSTWIVSRGERAPRLTSCFVK
jgi:hypothetical protein